MAVYILPLDDNKLFNACTKGEPRFSEVFNTAVLKLEVVDSFMFKQDIFYYAQRDEKMIYARETELACIGRDTIT